MLMNIVEAKGAQVLNEKGEILLVDVVLITAGNVTHVQGFTPEVDQDMKAMKIAEKVKQILVPTQPIKAVEHEARN